MASELSMAIASYEWQTVIDLVTAQPNLAQTKSTRLGFFEGKRPSTVVPLHEVVTGVAPVMVTFAVLQAFPNAAQVPETAYERLPLHCACRRNANPDVVQLLLEAFPHAAVVPDQLGRLPLHYALSNGADPAIINLLLQYSPAAARGVDNHGWTPLHVACSVGASIETIALLLHLFPEAVVFRTDKGSTAGGLLMNSAVNKTLSESYVNTVKEMIRQASIDFDQRFVNPLESEARRAEDLMIV